MQQRSMIGIIALVLFAGALYFYLWPPTVGEVYKLGFKSACFRIGACMAAVWLAYPDLHKLSRRSILWFTGTLVALAWQPRLIIVVLPVFLVWKFLKSPVKPNQDDS